MPTKGNRVRRFRIPPELDAALEAAIARHGADASDFMRACIRRGTLEKPGPTPTDMAEFYRLSRQLVGIAHNINQFVTMANQARLTGTPLPEAKELMDLARQAHKDSRTALAILDLWG